MSTTTSQAAHNHSNDSNSNRDNGDGHSAPEVLVYCGEGAGHQSVRNTLHALQRCVAPWVQVRSVGSSEVLEGGWRERCMLFVMPGGADLPYCKHLNGRGNQLLRDYVTAGGSYLGICAGAYYACGRVEFEPGGPLEVVGDRELVFFPGIARGAAYPGFDYMSERGACAAPLRLRPQRPEHGEANSAPAVYGGGNRAGAGGVSGTMDDEGAIAREPNSDATSAAAATAPPRLGAHHLSVQGGPGEGRGRLQDGGGGGCSSGGGDARDEIRDVGRSGDAAADRPVAAESAAAAGGDEYGNWVYCRDYSNGGPVFVLQPAGAECGGGSGGGNRSAAGAASPPVDDAVQGGPEVLAVYPELGNALAAVRCRVGEGVAVLCGTHPEMPAEVLTSSVHLYDGAQARHVAALGAELAVWEAQRRWLWGMLLLACCTAPTTEVSTRPSESTVAALWEGLRARAGGDDRAEVAVASAAAAEPVAQIRM